MMIGSRNKIYTVFILCIGIITSVWLLSRTSKQMTVKQKTDNVIDVYKNDLSEEERSDDWKKILVNLDPNQETTTILTNNNLETFDDTTLTAQMAKDFFSQYLLVKKGGRSLNPEDITRITESLFSSTKYTNASGAVYIASNLHISSKTDKESLKKYKETVNLSLKNGSMRIKDNPLTIMTNSLKSKNENELLKFDPLILIAKGFIKDFLLIEVPPEVVPLHLALLNSFSNLLSDLEAMRESFTDPVKSFAAVGQYSKEISSFQTALANWNSYFQSKNI